MTPKDKAEELVEKYDSTLTYLESKNKAKQCALIAVVEVMCEVTDEDDFSWWNKVKQEIELL